MTDAEPRVPDVELLRVKVDSGWYKREYPDPQGAEWVRGWPTMTVEALVDGRKQRPLVIPMYTADKETCEGAEQLAIEHLRAHHRCP